MLTITGKLLQVEEVRPKDGQGSPHNLLHVLGKNGKGPQIYKVKDYSGAPRKNGEDLTLPIAASSYLFNGSHGITYKHYGK